MERASITKEEKENLLLSLKAKFEEFAVYDTRVKPSKTGDASVVRISFGTSAHASFE